MIQRKMLKLQMKNFQMIYMLSESGLRTLRPDLNLTLKLTCLRILMELLTEPHGGAKDEVLAILTILSSHVEGKLGIGNAEVVPILVEVIESGSPRNKENAAAVLVQLCSGHPTTQHHHQPPSPLFSL